MNGVVRYAKDAPQATPIGYFLGEIKAGRACLISACIKIYRRQYHTDGIKGLQQAAAARGADGRAAAGGVVVTIQEAAGVRRGLW